MVRQNRLHLTIKQFINEFCASENGNNVTIICNSRAVFQSNLLRVLTAITEVFSEKQSQHFRWS